MFGQTLSNDAKYYLGNDTSKIDINEIIIAGVKATSKYVYKRLKLDGNKENIDDDVYFESISKDEFKELDHPEDF